MSEQSHDACCSGKPETCALQGPEIRTGFLKNPDQPIKLTPGKEITITTDYSYKGDDDTIAMRQATPALPCPAANLPMLHILHIAALPDETAERQSLRCAS